MGLRLRVPGLPDLAAGQLHRGDVLREAEHFLELLYLSINNLSSAGLGDIVPVKAPARVLVMLEQVAGVGYITVVVSRLIGMTILRRKRSKRTGSA